MIIYNFKRNTCIDFVKIRFQNQISRSSGKWKLFWICLIKFEQYNRRNHLTKLSYISPSSTTVITTGRTTRRRSNNFFSDPNMMSPTTFFVLLPWLTACLLLSLYSSVMVFLCPAYTSYLLYLGFWWFRYQFLWCFLICYCFFIILSDDINILEYSAS